MDSKPKLTDAEKKVFKDGAWRRRQNSIRLKRVQLMMDENHVVSILNFWDGWVVLLGKQGAADYLLVTMRRADEILQAEREKRERAAISKTLQK